jgi:hypothetical protein
MKRHTNASKKLPKFKFGREYLFLYKRIDKPNEKWSFFHVLYPEREEEVNGFIAYSLFLHRVFCKNLPDISGINLDNVKNIEKLGSTDRDKVKEYMEKSHIRDIEFLHTIRKHSTNVATLELKNKDGSTWGAVSIDNNSGEGFFEKIRLCCKHVCRYLKM